jgi:APA family basic amino acid/polyamine antiporter
VSSPAPMARRIGTTDAVVLGLGSMIGAGIFAVFAPAAGVAGPGLLIGLAIAAVVAFCNATSSAQLAAQHPTSGGTYVYGRAQLGPWPGFVAGWSFVVGKTASCAAMALTFAAYAAPAGWERPVGAAAILVLAGVNCVGVTRTAALTRVIVAFVVLVLVLAVVAGLAAGRAEAAPVDLTDVRGDWHDVLQSAGLMFFAFAGYARLATMGEEVKDPRRTIPRAITIALAVVVVLYALMASTLLAVLGTDGLAASDAPVADLATAGGWDWAGPVVRVAAAAAALGALLGLIAGVGRTGLAMARHGDLPAWLSAIHPRYDVPHRAQMTVAVVASVLVLTIDLRGAIGFSSFGVLLYYLVANASALTQTDDHRRWPRLVQVAGAVGCTVLALTLPDEAILGGVVVVLIGVGYRLADRRRREGRASG